jgi:hypothetical protein
LAKLADSSLGGSSDREFLSYMEEAIKSKFPKIRNKPVMTKETEKIIHSLKNKDSCGYDLISLRVLKLSSPYITNIEASRLLNVNNITRRLKRKKLFELVIR